MTKTTRRRVAILVAATLSLGGVVGGAYWYRQHQAAAKMAEYRQLGMQLYAQSQYSAALLPLSKYIGRNQLDAPALIAYGRSRALTVEPDNHHIVEGIGILRRYREIAPDDLDAEKLLLDLYTKAAWSNEAIALADSLLTKDPKDADALQARYIGLERMQKWSDALTAVKTYLNVRPTDLAGHWDVLELLHQLNAPREAATNHAKEYVAKIGEDHPCAYLLQAQVATFIGNRALALENVKRATDRAFASPAAKGFELNATFVRFAADIYDRLGEYKASEEFVVKAADSNAKDPELASTLALRLWVSNNSDALLRRTDSLDPASKSSPATILGLRALTLMQAKRDADAKALVDALAKRDDDPLAAAWAVALRAAYFEPKSTQKDRQKEYRDALVRSLSQQDLVAVGIINHLLAGVNWDLGETELAIANWEQASKALPQWMEPSEHLVTAQIQAGRPGEALKIAETMCRRSPTVAHTMQEFDAWSATLKQSRDPESAKGLLKAIESVRKDTNGDPRLLPPEVIARTVLGDLPTAGKIVQAGLSNPNTPANVLTSLADAANFASIDVENQADAALARAGSAATPDRALARSLKLAARGQKEDALAELERAAANAKGAAAGATAKSDATAAGAVPAAGAAATADKSAGAPAINSAAEWDIALARFRDETGDDKALPAMKELAEKYPTVLKAQMTVLASRAAWNDRKLISTTIDQAKTISGDDAINWRVAKARLLLQGDDQYKPSDREAAEAVVLLSDIVRVAPQLLPPRLLLAQALNSVNNTAGAYEQLASAARIAPDSPVVVLKLVQMLEKQGRTDEARAAARNILNSPRLTLGQRIQFANVLSRLGDGTAAAEVLARSSGAGDAAALSKQDNIQDDIRGKITLARLYMQQNRSADAVEAIKPLMDDKVKSRLSADDAREVYTITAEIYAAAGQVDKARGILESALAESDKAIADSVRAKFEERFGDKDKALTLLRGVVASNPNNAAYHSQLAGLLLRLGKNDEANRVIAAGLTVAPGDPTLSILSRATETAAAIKDKSKIQLLMVAVSEDPTAPAIPATFDALRRGAYALTDPATIDGLRDVAAKYPNFLPAHAMVVQSYLDIGRSRDAAEAGQRCVAALPTNSDAAALAVAALLAADDPQSALGAARRWRELTDENPLPADLAISAAELALRNPGAANRQLRQYVKGGSVPTPVLLLLTQAQLAEGETKSAWMNASGLWKNQPALRTRLLASIIDASYGTTGGSARDQAFELLDRMDKELAADANDHFLLAQSFARLGDEHGGDNAYARTIEIVKSLDKDGKLPTAARVLLAEVYRRQQNFTDAEAQYRAALAEDANSAVVRNNLADLLVRRDGSRKDAAAAREAADLARAAIAADPRKGAFYDTLGRALEALGQSDAALASYEKAIQLQGDTIETLVAYGSLLKQTDRKRELAAVLLKLESLLPAGETLAPGRRSAQLDVDTQRRLTDLRGATSSTR